VRRRYGGYEEESSRRRRRVTGLRSGTCRSCLRHEAPCHIPGCSREELEGRFLGLMANLDPKR